VDIETLSALNQDSYRVLLMLIQGLTMVLGFASAMFVVVSVVCAACDFFGDTRQSARRRTKQASEACAYEPLGAHASLEYSLDQRLQRGATSSIQ
jgi:hypothetical protein